MGFIACLLHKDGYIFLDRNFPSCTGEEAFEWVGDRNKTPHSLPDITSSNTRIRARMTLVVDHVRYVSGRPPSHEADHVSHVSRRPPSHVSDHVSASV